MLFEQIAQNKRKTIWVMFWFVALVAVLGAAVGYLVVASWQFGVVVAVVVGGFYSLIMLGQGVDIAMSLNHATELTDKRQAPELFHIVEDMAMVGKVPMPRVFVIEDDSPNAFATGSNPQNAAVAVTRGLMARLDRYELEGVIAHEISHIKNYDIRLQTTALALASAVSFLANLGSNWLWWGGGVRRDERDERDGNNALLLLLSVVLVIFAPLAAMLAQMALSRNREYLADASAVELTRNPQGLIDALKAITSAEPMQQADASSASMYFANPFAADSWTHLFDTHPPVAKRIERLEHM